MHSQPTIPSQPLFLHSQLFSLNLPFQPLVLLSQPIDAQLYRWYESRFLNSSQVEEMKIPATLDIMYQESESDPSRRTLFFIDPYPCLSLPISMPVISLLLHFQSVFCMSTPISCPFPLTPSLSLRPLSLLT